MTIEPGHTLTSAQAAAEIFAITYWVPHPDDDLVDASIFQGFLPGILSTAELFERVAGMPFDVRELFADRSDVVYARLGGFARTRAIPVRISAFEKMIALNQTLFNVVVSVDSVASRASHAIQSAGRDWLHISESPQPQTTPIDQVNEQLFVEYFRRVARAQTDPVLARVFCEFLEGTVRVWPALSVDCPRYMHNLTRPNELALEALRISLRGVEAMGPQVPNLYVSGSVRSARAVGSMREALTTKHRIPPHANDLTLCIDSVAWGVSRTDIRQRVIDAGTTRSEAGFVQAIVERTGYASELRVPDARQIFGGLANAVLAMRSAELRALTSALLLHSGLRLTPVVRLNPGLNEVRPALIDIGNCARGNGPHRDFKLNKLGRRLSQRMSDIVDKRMISAIRGPSNRIGEVSMVADLPLEWLPIDGIPLGLKHDVSRVPCNPGNVMFAQCVSNEISFVSKDSFDEILVVRSFLPGDPIAGHLEAALSRQFGGDDAPSATIKFVDVSTPSEFVKAVSGYKGSLLIFDGHGSRDTNTGVGTIIVGGKPLDVWSLRDELTFPPIVLLSACDTYPIDGSHGSAAVGMLALGARTVLGTMLPIHSVRSCSLLSRLIYRLAAFLPIAMKMYPNGVNWRFMMSGMLRMVYASEVIYSFSVFVRMNPLQRSKIQYEANTDINSRNPKWLDLLQKRLATAANIPVARARSYCDSYAWITDSLKYVQLGRPELIHIVSTVPADIWSDSDSDARDAQGI